MRYYLELESFIPFHLKMLRIFSKSRPLETGTESRIR
jgi:hypothetical protein